ncbi:MAG TPA: Ig-like domain-containing protein [Anaerolineales bacterium]|nr:Ig-like domain-containing protein [Anaerolineales bacterium]
MVVFLLLVIGGVAAYAWNSSPQLIRVTPQPGAENVGATGSIRLEFSRSMDQRSVESRLQIFPAVEGLILWDENSLIFTPHQPWLTGQNVQVQLERGAKAASWLAFSMHGDSWEFTIGQTNLAYLWPSSGSADIYSLDPITGTIRQYTHGMNVLDYSANTAGSKFYFSAGNAKSGADLYLVDRIKADSVTQSPYQPEKLMDCGEAQCRNPVVSPDGKALAYEYLAATTIGRVSLVQIWTLSLPDLVAAPGGQAQHETVQPMWSPTGLLAYYDRTSRCYEIFDRATQVREQLPNQTGQPGVWATDGAYYLAPEISYQQTSNSFETGSSHLIRYRISDKTVEDISGADAVEDVEAVYSPDGKSIAFTRKSLDAAHWSPGRQIWVMDSDGANPHPIIDEADYNHYDLAWRQDSSQLAYVRFNQESISDPPELWMINVDGGKPIQLKVGGYSPIWIP